MILQIRCGEVEATIDTEGEGLSPEAAQEYLLRATRVAYSLWRSLPDETSEATSEADD